MSTETEAAIERLREHANDFVGTSTTAVERDILAVCNAAERGEADTKRLKEIRELWQSGMPNFDTKCIEFSFETANKMEAVIRGIDAAMKEGK